MPAFAIFLTTTKDGWRLGIGDPTVMGWLTVVGYAVATYLAVLAARQLRLGVLEGQPGALPLYRLWLFISLLLFALGVNKQLDLQTLFTFAMRKLALSQGWYEDRRRFQLAFVLAIGVLGAGFTYWLARSLRTVLAEALVAVIGIGMLLSFVVIRAASFHYVDVLLTHGPVRLNWVLELGGIGILGYAARRAREQAQHQLRSTQLRRAAGGK